MIEENDKIDIGKILVKIPRKSSKAGEIKGGLPRVKELFEARNPSNPAVVSEIDGVVSFGKIKRGNREIIIESKTGAIKKYLVKLSNQILVQENDFVKAGMPLSDGSVTPNDILNIKGPSAVQQFLVNEVQEVYRLQGVKINDKHFEVVVRQMMRKVRIQDSGDTIFLENQLVHKSDFIDENDDILLALLPLAGLATLGYAVGAIGRAGLKERTHALLLGNALPEAVAARAAARFADRIVGTGVYAGALAQIAADRAAGYRLVLATASYGFYARAIAERLGFDAVIATGVVQEGGVLRARIAGENCYGAAKLRMIEAWLAAQGIARADAVVRFYSDHVSDAPSLQWADVGIATNPHRRLRTLAHARGWAVEDWER